MVMGIISVVVGVIIILVHFIRYIDDTSAVRQTVQYLGYVCGSIFLVGGMIMCLIGDYQKKTRSTSGIATSADGNANIKIQKGL